MSSMARMPKAPGLFSITTGWPRIGRMCSPTMRMTMSVALPGPNGTTTLTGLFGYLSWACACTPAKARHSAIKTHERRIFILLVFRCASFRGLDLHLAGDVLPGLDFVGEPSPGVVQ